MCKHRYIFFQTDRITALCKQRCLYLQTDKISALQKRIEQIQHLLDDSCNIPEKVYSPITQPNLVHLVLRKGEGDGEGVRKTFLLDCGRLQLEQVKLAFQLATVELIIGKENRASIFVIYDTTYKISFRRDFR